MMSSNKFDRRKFMTASAAGLAGAALSGCSVLDTRGYKASFGELNGRFSAQPLPPLGPKDDRGIDESWFKNFITDFVRNNPANSMERKEFAGEKIYKDPLVGFVSGNDPLFMEFKKIIGPFHHTPEEAITWAAYQQNIKVPSIKKVGVVSFILPFTDPIVETNAAEDRWCSARWAQARLVGGLFRQKIEQAMIEEMAKRGILAVSPVMMPDFRTKKYESVGWASTWSIRHIAFAAGLGSFGMNDMFISEKGTAHRCGSLVVAVPLEPDRKRHPHYRYNCLHYQTGGCLMCAERCPVGAISEAGHDKNKCGKNVVSSWPHHVIHNNINIYGCGLCSTNTPCSQGIPE